MGRNCAYAENALLANQLDMLIFDRSLAISLAICLEVAQVTDMSLGITWGTVCLAERVEMRAGARAAVGVVAELVDVHATLSGGITSRDVVGDSGLA